jgi:hypothetical protein
VHDNTSGKSYRPATVAEAARLTRELIDRGHSVDIGLAQINSKNLHGWGWASIRFSIPARICTPRRRF